MKRCTLLGAPIGTGNGQRGCQLGPDTLRIAGLPEMLADLGYQTRDLGNAAPNGVRERPHDFNAKNLAEAVAWTESLQDTAYRAACAGDFSIFLGGDHSMAFGTVPAMARYAQEQSRPLYVLWIDAHTDFHALDTSESGNIHGMPVAYIVGDRSFEGYFPPLPGRLPVENICILGIRSVDPAERRKLSEAGITAYDMRKVDEKGISSLLKPFLQTIRETNGLLHVSLDVDGLDPAIAPAVGTTVPGGLTAREAHLIMEMIHDEGLAVSLDLVEFNPLLDEAGRTAHLLIDLTASLLGRSVLG